MALRKFKILVADDDAEFVSVVRDFLEHEGYETMAAFEGIRTVEIANKQHPDLILLDLMMPAGRGDSVLRTLRSRMETEKIPVIVVTAVSKPDVQEEAKKAGANDFLQKPYQAKSLLEKIRTLLPKQQS